MYELFGGDEEDCFVMLEWWSDAAAIDAHLKTPHIQTGRRSTIHSLSFSVILFWLKVTDVDVYFTN